MFCLLLAGDKLWWADQASERMGTCKKKDGSEVTVLRNSTTLVMHMKVYDESIQQGERAVPAPRPRSGRSARRPHPPSLHGSWNQPLQPQQRRLLAALPAHVRELPLLHVHGRLQPEERAAVLRR